MQKNNSETLEHHAHLGTGNGVIQFICCLRAEHPYDMLWSAPAPDGRWAANVFYTSRQAYDSIVRHLTRDHESDPAFVPVVAAADALVGPDGDARLGVRHLAEHLGTVALEERQR